MFVPALVGLVAGSSLSSCVRDPISEECCPDHEDQAKENRDLTDPV